MGVQVVGTVGRVRLLIKRMISARRLGVSFRGVSRFRLPLRCRLCGTEVGIEAPLEGSLRSDFINVLLDDEYGLKQLLEPPRTICDIGGNIGLFSLWARHCFPDATIHCYEPNPRVFEFMRRNLEGKGIEVFPEAIGAERGRVEMDDRWDSRNAKARAVAEGSVEMVAIRTVIDRLGGQVDLLKMDCEGGEWDIFRDVATLACVNRIRMEYHLTGQEKSVEEFRRLVESAGFQCEMLREQIGFGIAWLSPGTGGI